MNRLTAEMFEQIVASLRSDGSRRSQEKRNRPRVGLRKSLEIFPCPVGAKLTAATVVWVRDVSADGLGLVSPCSFPMNMQFVAEFDRWESDRLRVQYKVAYCKLLSRGLYSVGAKLEKVLPARSDTAAKPQARKSA